LSFDLCVFNTKALFGEFTSVIQKGKQKVQEGIKGMEEW